jgi:hypothetical protein
MHQCDVLTMHHSAIYDIVPFAMKRTIRITVNVDPARWKALQALASSDPDAEHSASWHLRQAMKEYLEHQSVLTRRPFRGSRPKSNQLPLEPSQATDWPRCNKCQQLHPARSACPPSQSDRQHSLVPFGGALSEPIAGRKADDR